MRLFSKAPKPRRETYVNLTYVDPFGYIASQSFNSSRAARVEARDGSRTMTTTTACHMLLHSARNVRRADYIRAWLRRYQDIADELAFVKARTAGWTEPSEAVGDLPEKTWAMLQDLRLALADSGRVRPYLLPSGRVSTTEVQVTLTEHEIQALIMRLAARRPDDTGSLKLSVADEKVNP